MGLGPLLQVVSPHLMHSLPVQYHSWWEWLAKRETFTHNTLLCEPQWQKLSSSLKMCLLNVHAYFERFTHWSIALDWSSHTYNWTLHKQLVCLFSVYLNTLLRERVCNFTLVMRFAEFNIASINLHLFKQNICSH